MTQPRATVFIVDDDEGVRLSLKDLLSSAGWHAAAYSTGLEFLENYHHNQPGCLLLDVRLPGGLSGLDLLKRLATQTPCLPVIMLTGHADVPMAVRAMKHGAMDFLQKPFNDQDLLDRVQEAIELDYRNRPKHEAHQLVRHRYQSLTDREGEILGCIMKGSLNKVIALELNISERTVEHHRAKIMQKMNAGSVAALVQMIIQLQSEQGS